MDLKQLQYFIVIAEQRSFSRAADMLDLSQPSLSRQIQLLEAELGQHLLVRTGRGVELTEAGARLLGHARTLHHLATQARQDLINFRSSAPGRVRLGIPPRIARRLAPSIMQQFRAQFPDSSITLAEGLSAQLRDWLLKDKVDLALLYEPAPSSLMQVESLYRENLVLAHAHANGLTLPAQVPVADLGAYPLVLPSAPNTIRTLVEQTCRDRNVQLNVVAEVDVVQTIVETLSYSHEPVFTIIPRSALGDIPGQANLRCAPIVEPAIRNNLTLAIATVAVESRLVLAVADIIRNIDMSDKMS